MNQKIRAGKTERYYNGSSCTLKREFRLHVDSSTSLSLKGSTEANSHGLGALSRYVTLDLKS